MVEGEVGVLEVVEPAPALDRIGVGPARAGAKRVEIEVQREAREGVGRAVVVLDTLVAAQHTRGLVQPRGDLVGDVLLPIRRRGIGRGLLQREESQDEHGRLGGRG